MYLELYQYLLLFDTNKLYNDSYISLVKLIYDNIYKKKQNRLKFRTSEN